MEFDGIITLEKLIFFAGLALFACWVRKTSLGRKSLADSVPRRNNMPLYLPFIPLFIWFGIVSLIAWIAQTLFSDLQDWQNDFLDNLILCISELSAIAVIIFLARIHFARRLKGFGLNIKTIVKDFFAAFVNLLAVWPLIVSAMVITIYFGELFWGQEFEMQQHQQLKLVSEHSQLLSRILIVVVAVIIVPLLEELLFRGLFLRNYQGLFGSRYANLLTAIVFTLGHVQVTYTPDVLSFLVILMVLALAWGHLMLKTESVWGSALFHAGADIPVVIGIYSTLS